MPPKKAKGKKKGGKKAAAKALAEQQAQAQLAVRSSGVNSSGGATELTGRGSHVFA